MFPALGNPLVLRMPLPVFCIAVLCLAARQYDRFYNNADIAGRVTYKLLEALESGHVFQPMPCRPATVV